VLNALICSAPSKGEGYGVYIAQPQNPTVTLKLVQNRTLRFKTGQSEISQTPDPSATFRINPDILSKLDYPNFLDIPKFEISAHTANPRLIHKTNLLQGKTIYLKINLFSRMIFRPT